MTDDIVQTTAGASNDDDIKALNDLEASLEEEQAQTNQVYADAAKQIDAATAADMSTVDDSLAQLDTLEDQADEEEKQGQIGQARDQVQQS
jgi:hypothetical protein